MSKGTRESESQNKGPENAGSGESVKTPLVPASPQYRPTYGRVRSSKAFG